MKREFSKERSRRRRRRCVEWLTESSRHCSSGRCLKGKKEERKHKKTENYQNGMVANKNTGMRGEPKHFVLFSRTFRLSFFFFFTFPLIFNSCSSFPDAHRLLLCDLPHLSSETASRNATSTFATCMTSTAGCQSWRSSRLRGRCCSTWTMSEQCTPRMASTRRLRPRGSQL